MSVHEDFFEKSRNAGVGVDLVKEDDNLALILFVATQWLLSSDPLIVDHHVFYDFLFSDTGMDIQCNALSIDNLSEIVNERCLSNTCLTHQYNRQVCSKSQMNQYQLHKVVQGKNDILQVVRCPQHLFARLTVNAYLKNMIYNFKLLH